ncbi:protein phosphatase 2C domain-containing protein [Antrihabitans sp. YC2-6]|uniref:protein phosphatase 2C domain-containing protein n=1 Tax=Antrihabitans sp. YC2-6 TaxID=2799498 RepID=UPI0018F6C0A9|nr:protein phosphatase 2C domain-containing protein [Antrihabitans sp. YC2-6]MBJ8347985.1 protein phosphatase 2C domain-containing protein [Antrihabitans sp. YC2-6]
MPLGTAGGRGLRRVLPILAILAVAMFAALTWWTAARNDGGTASPIVAEPATPEPTPAMELDPVAVSREIALTLGKSDRRLAEACALDGAEPQSDPPRERTRFGDQEFVVCAPGQARLPNLGEKAVLPANGQLDFDTQGKTPIAVLRIEDDVIVVIQLSDKVFTIATDIGTEPADHAGPTTTASGGDPIARWPLVLWLVLSSIISAALIYLWAARPTAVAEYSPVRSARVPPTAPPTRLGQRTTSGSSGLTVDRGTAGQFETYAASQVGLSHSTYGRIREDSYAIASWPDDGWAFLAIADGVGSSVNSHIASKIAVEVAVSTLQENLPARGRPTLDPAEWARFSRHLVETVAREMRGRPIEQLAKIDGFASLTPTQKTNTDPSCTLIVVALGPETGGRYPVFWATVGDSDLVFVDDRTGVIDWATNNSQKVGPIVSNVTWALPRDVNQMSSGSALRSRDTAVVLMTDGMADIFRGAERTVAAQLATVTATRPHEHVFAEIINVDVPGLTDDRTLVAAWPAARGPVQKRDRGRE